MSSLWQVIQSQLEETVSRMGLSGLALANEDGLLIASAGYGVDAELVATVNPLHEGMDHGLMADAQANLHQNGLALEVQHIQRGHQALFLCATSQQSQSRGADLRSLLQDLAERIGI